MRKRLSFNYFFVVVVQLLSYVLVFGLQPTRFLCSWDFPAKNTGVDCHFLLQGIFLTQGLNPCPLLGKTIFTAESPGKRFTFLLKSVPQNSGSVGQCLSLSLKQVELTRNHHGCFSPPCRVSLSLDKYSHRRFWGPDTVLGTGNIYGASKKNFFF